jgi:hypothetical protein
MSASCYTHRIKVKTQARNAKVQYPGRKAVYDSIHATCAVNPDFSILEYTDISLSCSKGKYCIRPVPIVIILDSGNSLSNSNTIYNGGSSNSNYTLVLDGGNSSS